MEDRGQVSPKHERCSHLVAEMGHCMLAFNKPEGFFFFNKRKERSLNVTKWARTEFNLETMFFFYYFVNRLALRLYTTYIFWVWPSETQRSVQRGGSGVVRARRRFFQWLRITPLPPWRPPILKLPVSDFSTKQKRQKPKKSKDHGTRHFSNNGGGN